MHTNKEVIKFFDKNIDISDFQGVVDDEQFLFLVKYLKKEEVQNLIYIVNKKEHIETLIKDYDLDLKKVNLLDKYWSTNYTVEHLETLKKYQCASLNKIYINILSNANEKIELREKYKDCLNFIVKNLKMEPVFLNILNPIDYVEMIKENRDDAIDFMMYYAKSSSSNRFSENYYEEKNITNFFETIGKENFLYLYNNERFFKNINIKMLITNGNLEIKDFNYLRTIDLNGKIKIYNTNNTYPAYYNLFDDLNDSLIINEKMVLNEDIDLSLLDYNTDHLFNILRNISAKEVLKFMKSLYLLEPNKINISNEEEDLFLILISSMNNTLNYNFKYNDIQYKKQVLTEMQEIFDDALELSKQSGVDFLKNKKVLPNKLSNDLLNILINSKILVSTEYNKIKNNLWTLLDKENDIKNIFFKNKFIEREKDIILNNLNDLNNNEYLNNKKRM